MKMKFVCEDYVLFSAVVIFFFSILAFVENKSTTDILITKSMDTNGSGVDAFAPYAKLLSRFEFLKLVPLNQPLFLIEHGPAGGRILFTFSALNQTFCLINQLKPSDTDRWESSFADDGKIIIMSTNNLVTKEIAAKDVREYINFIGEVSGDQMSHVHGRLTKTQFEGVIRTKNEVYFVEKFDNSTNAVVYQLSDLKCLVTRRSNHSINAVGTCGELIQQDYIARHLNKIYEQSEMDRDGSKMWPKDCMVQVIVDYSFYVHVGAMKINRTIAEVEMHFREVNLFLARNDFNKDGKVNDMRLVISKLKIITKPTSQQHDDLIIRINSLDYLLTLINNSSFEDTCTVVLFTFNRFIGPESNRLFINLPLNSHSLPLSPYSKRLPATCGLNAWILSFNGFGNFKFPRAMSIIRMVSHVGYLLGIDEFSKKTKQCDNYFSSSGSDWLNTLTFSKCGRKIIAESVNRGELCSSRSQIRNIRDWSTELIDIDNNRLKYTNFSQWFRNRRLIPQEPTDESPDDNEHEKMRQYIREWWNAPHPWSSFGQNVDEFNENASDGAIYWSSNNKYFVAIIICLWLICICRI